MTAQAFLDESGRGSRYYVCVVVVANDDVDAVRRLARTFCLPGQRRWHFVHESQRRRQQIVDAIMACGQVNALVYFGTGKDAGIRAEALRRLVDPLIERRVTRLIIESRQGRDDLDRQVLIARLRTRPDAFLYDHLPPHADPLLWVADALAWCSSAQGSWRDRIAATPRRRRSTVDGLALNSAKPGRSPSGEEPGSLPEAHRNRLSQV